MVCVCVEMEGCKLEELAAQELLRSDLSFLMKEVTQRACCLLINYCAVFFNSTFWSGNASDVFGSPVTLRFF